MENPRVDLLLREIEDDVARYNEEQNELESSQEDLMASFVHNEQVQQENIALQIEQQKE